MQKLMLKTIISLFTLFIFLNTNQAQVLDNNYKPVILSSGGGFIHTMKNLSDGKILIAGKFSSVDGKNISNIARLDVDGKIDKSFLVSSGTDAWVRALAIQKDGKILIGGEFSYFDNQSANRIIRLNSDGSIDNTFKYRTGFANGSVYAIYVQNDGKILVGGDFQSYNGISSRGLIRLNKDGSADNTFNMAFDIVKGAINSIAVQDDGKILIGGWFISAGFKKNYFVRLNTEGEIDKSFKIGTSADYFVSAITIQEDGNILVGGWFNKFNFEKANKLIRITKDGVMDKDFNIGEGFEGEYIHQIILMKDNSLLIAGNFSVYNNITSTCIAKLTSDGTMDAKFKSDYGELNGVINSILVQSDGSLVVGGTFSSFDTTQRTAIARLYNTGLETLITKDKNLEGATDENASGVNDTKIAINVNPTNKNYSQIVIESKYLGEFEYVISDEAGKELFKEKILKSYVNHQFELNLANQPVGVYYLKMIFKDETITKKIIKN